MNPLRSAFSALLALIVVVLLFSSTYTLRETDQAIITQFGRPVGSPVTEPGLHWKAPLIQTVNRLEKRVLEWDGAPNEMPTKDKTYIQVDTFARWRISDPTQFFVRIRLRVCITKSLGQALLNLLPDVCSDGLSEGRIEHFFFQQVFFVVADRIFNRPLFQ